jgi:hypothetical protein
MVMILLKIYPGNVEFKNFSFANRVTREKGFEMRKNIESLYSAIYVPAKIIFMDSSKTVRIYMISTGYNRINNDETVEVGNITLKGERSTTC